mmetsp:Transcript_59699/g.134557  ORF Transcript_59699/g.134557 Transcript_59699/m.134557 type:complete len:341 (-) Transcript_59699:89-1111(-)|eukprot:CAMPEP_0197914838 /NCGR_PEP_ID=MMETSP1439-20131203/79187_1 /TAXON_ID=66791 /ORGANISM="Gonyaulax spinifera, Strain CCMP409" /LENGTH=340 /DNA_ID=CAMNT_0043536763 /DNA_START=144 /DNA_END=1166 /DNA_ORIENTATION=+
MGHRGSNKKKRLLKDGTYLGQGASYRIDGELASGNTGASVYRALLSETIEVAVKYPVTEEELRALKFIRQKAPGCPGVLQMTASGVEGGGVYIVMPRLGGSITPLLERLPSVPSHSRWSFVSTIGRMLLRTLEGIHRCGIAHCDVQPNNVLVGQVDDARSRRHTPFRPFLVDFGNARPFPGGAPMKGTWGSIDFNPIRSADGGERGPFDDLESLGWVLCHAFAGDLPWFKYTRKAWEVGKWEPEAVATALQEVHTAKRQVQNRGWGAFGSKWVHLVDMPVQLNTFLQRCWAGGGGLPDYRQLEVILGGRESLDAEEREERDLASFNEEVVPLIDLADLCL